VTYDGAVPYDTPTWQDSRIYFRERGSGRRYAIEGQAGTYAGRVPPGTYDVTYEGVYTWAELPNDLGEIPVASGVVISRDRTLNLDAEVYNLTGTLSLDGVHPQAFIGGDVWELWFEPTDGGAIRSFEQRGSTWAADVPAGTWDVYYQYRYWLSGDNPRVALARGLVVDADARIELGATMERVTGTALIDGLTPEDRPFIWDFEVTLEDLETGASHTVVGYAGAYEVAVPPGIYDVRLDDIPVRYCLLVEGDSDDGDFVWDSGLDVTDVTDDTAWAFHADTGVTPVDTGPPDPVVPIDYCHLQYPCTLEVQRGVASEPVYVWVYQDGATPGAGQGPGVQVELGWGPDGGHPEDGGWTWAPMSFFADKDGLTPGDLANDEYSGAFVPRARGTWDYAARASADGGVSWTLCDDGGITCGGVGSSDGYDAANAGELIVR
jgi:hypothetical protein